MQIILKSITLPSLNNFLESLVNCIIIYPASRGFSLAWLLEFTKSFAGLLYRVVGCFSWGIKKLTKRQTSHANNFQNAKSQERAKPLLAG